MDSYFLKYRKGGLCTFWSCAFERRILVSLGFHWYLLPSPTAELRLIYTVFILQLFIGLKAEVCLKASPYGWHKKMDVAFRVNLFYDNNGSVSKALQKHKQQVLFTYKKMMHLIVRNWGQVSYLMLLFPMLCSLLLKALATVRNI